MLLPATYFVHMQFLFSILFPRYSYFETTFIESAYYETSFSLSSGLTFYKTFFYIFKPVFCETSFCSFIEKTSVKQDPKTPSVLKFSGVLFALKSDGPSW